MIADIIPFFGMVFFLLHTGFPTLFVGHLVAQEQENESEYKYSDSFDDRKYSPKMIRTAPVTAPLGTDENGLSRVAITASLSGPWSWKLEVLRCGLREKDGKDAAVCSVIRTVKTGKSQQVKAVWNSRLDGDEIADDGVYPVVLSAYDKSRWQTKLGMTAVKSLHQTASEIISGPTATPARFAVSQGTQFKATLRTARSWRLTVLFPGFSDPLRVFKGRSKAISIHWDGKDEQGKPMMAGGEFVLALEVRDRDEDPPIAVSHGLVRTR